MPLFEHYCQNCRDVVESISRFDDPSPRCEKCGSQRRRAISSFGIVGTGTLSRKYNDPKLEGYNLEGHWVKATDPKTGKRTIPVFIDTFQKQREYCKQEGFYDPGEIGQVEPHADGKAYSCRGLPGCW